MRRHRRHFVSSATWCFCRLERGRRTGTKDRRADWSAHLRSQPIADPHRSQRHTDWLIGLCGRCFRYFCDEMKKNFFWRHLEGASLALKGFPCWEAVAPWRSLFLFRFPVSIVVSHFSWRLTIFWWISDGFGSNGRHPFGPARFPLESGSI